MKNKSVLAIILISIVVTAYLNILQPFDPPRVYQTQQQENLILYQDVTDAISKKPIAPLSDEDFIIKNDDNFVELGNTFKNLKTDEKNADIQYANEKHAYDIYAFKNFTISTQPLDEGIIFSIYLTTPILKTFRNISIGDTISDVFEKYGLVDEVPSGLYMYRYNDKILTFYADESGKVTGIHFQFV